MPNSSESTHKLRALKFSAIAIASVVIVEVVLGLTVNSLAILSDGLHALLDALTGIMLFAATKAALKPPDEEHTYGHEKFESIGGLTGGIVLIGVGILIIYQAALKLIQSEGVNPGLQLAGFVAIGYTFCIDIIRIYLFRKATNNESSTVKAGFYHAVADLSSTGIAFLGFGFATIGFNQGDSLASIVLGTLLSFMSIRLVRSSIMDLSDTTSKELVQKTRKECENLKVRKVGSKIFMESTVQVSSSMNLEEAHALASKIEANLKGTFGNVDATIHIEPSEEETKMDQLVKKLAAVEGMREVHEISTVYASGRLYITLHACVDSKLSVEEAHEIAEKIENRMREEIKQLENATVHVEPYGVEVRAAEINENALRRIIQSVVKNVERTLHIKKIVTYMADEKRFINLDCCFTNQVSITEAHETATRIEEAIKERFADAVVTVHIEPDCAS
jgi:cation diffusion facilitator family transporter